MNQLENTDGKNKISSNKIKNKIIGYINTIRLEGAILAIVFLLLAEYISLGYFPLRLTIFSILAVSGIATAGSWINYVFDKEMDEIAEKNISFFDYISKKEMLFFSFLLSFICLILLLC